MKASLPVRSFLALLALLAFSLAPGEPNCTPVPVEPPPDCVVDEDCDDGEDCTEDRCDPDVGCTNRLTETCNGLRDIQCHDAIDNDGDGLIDMDDWDCAMVPCQPGPEECDNGIDDDLDGVEDCDDPDCSEDPACRS